MGAAAAFAGSENTALLLMAERLYGLRQCVEEMDECAHRKFVLLSSSALQKIRS